MADGGGFQARRVSVDAPAWFQGQHTEMNELESAMHMARIASGNTRGSLRHDLERTNPRNPLSSAGGPTQKRKDELDLTGAYHIRLKDEEAFENRYRRMLSSSPSDFRREKGGNQLYMEQAVENRDMLAWKHSSKRADTRGSMRMVSSPEREEIYGDALLSQTFTDTSRLSRAPDLQERHSATRSSAHAKWRTASNRRRQQQEQEQHELTRKHREYNAARRQRREQKELDDARAELDEFQVAHGASMDLDNCSKSELIRLLEHAGWSIPMEEIVDEVSGKVTHNLFSKNVYLDLCNKCVAHRKQTPVVQRACLLGSKKAVVSVFCSPSGVARLMVYDLASSHESRMALTKFKLQTLHIASPPAPDAPKADWNAWLRSLLERMSLTDDCDIVIGVPKVGANGLPRGFALVERVPDAALSSRPPSPGMRGDGTSFGATAASSSRRSRSSNSPDPLGLTSFGPTTTNTLQRGHYTDEQGPGSGKLKVTFAEDTVGVPEIQDDDELGETDPEGLAQPNTMSVTQFFNAFGPAAAGSQS